MSVSDPANYRKSRETYQRMVARLDSRTRSAAGSRRPRVVVDVEPAARRQHWFPSVLLSDRISRDGTVSVLFLDARTDFESTRDTSGGAGVMWLQWPVITTFEVPADQVRAIEPRDQRFEDLLGALDGYFASAREPGDPARLETLLDSLTANGRHGYDYRPPANRTPLRLRRESQLGRLVARATAPLREGRGV